MAIVKIIAIRDRLDKRVNYAINGEKTTLDAGITYAVNSEKTKQHFFASAKQINRIFERMGYPAPVREDAAKKASARAPSENSSKERGNGARISTEMASEKKPSVRAKMQELKKVSEQMVRQAKTIADQEHEQR